MSRGAAGNSGESLILLANFLERFSIQNAGLFKGIEVKKKSKTII